MTFCESTNLGALVLKFSDQYLDLMVIWFFFFLFFPRGISSQVEEQLWSLYRCINFCRTFEKSVLNQIAFVALLKEGSSPTQRLMWRNGCLQEKQQISVRHPTAKLRWKHHLGMMGVSARQGKVSIWLNDTISGSIILVVLQANSWKLDLALLLTTSPTWHGVLWLLALLLEIGWNNAAQQIFYSRVNTEGGKVFKWLIELVWNSHEILLGARAG